MDGSSGLVTILFTDLVGSTELLSRAGEEAVLEADLDAPRARSLLDSARREFEALGMTGWLRKVGELEP
jgi:class 3 adenylate cyclase